MGMGLTLIIILGMIGSFLFAKIRLPGLLGMLIVGIVIGPYGLGLINQSILDISADLRMIALVVIILRAGLGLKRKDIQAIGKPALKMSVIPALFEGLTIAVVSMWLLKFSFIQGGILGFIISAVSPAVIVPLMLKLQDEKLGTNKSIPTLILSAASIDDVFAITLFTSFLSLYMNKSYQVSKQLVAVPLAIILGIAFGLMVGFTIVWLFKRFTINDSKKLLIILSLAIMMTFTEEVLQDYIKIASLLGVMALGFIITDALPHVGKKLSFMFGQVWIG